MVLIKYFLSRPRTENVRSEVAVDTGNAKRDADKTIYALAAIFGTKTCVCVWGEGGGFEGLLLPLLPLLRRLCTFLLFHLLFCS